MDHGGLARCVAVADERLDSHPAFDAVTTMRPEPCGTMTRAALRMVCTTPLRLTSITCPSPNAPVGKRLAVLRAEAGDQGEPRVRKCHVDSALGFGHVVEQRIHRRFVADVDDKTPRVEPAVNESRGRASSRSAWMSASVTRAPHSASTSAIANPRPAAAPVMTTRVPRTSNSRPSTCVGSVMRTILRFLPCASHCSPKPSRSRSSCATSKRRWRSYVRDYGIGPWAIYEFNPENVTGMHEGGEPVERSWRLALE